MKHLKEEIEQQGKSQYGRNDKSIILHSFDNKLITYMSNKINDYNYFYGFTLFFFFLQRKTLGHLGKKTGNPWLSQLQFLHSSLLDICYLTAYDRITYKLNTFTFVLYIMFYH